MSTPTNDAATLAQTHESAIAAFIPAAVVVVDAPSCASAVELRAEIGRRLKIIETEFAKPKSSAYQAHKDIVALEAKIRKPLDELDATAKKAIKDWNDAEEAKRRAEEQRLAQIAKEEADRRALAEAAELERAAAAATNANGREEMLAEAAELVETAIAAPPPPVMLPQTKTTVAGLKTREVWHFRIDDANKVPRQYLAVNEQAIGGTVRALKGQTSIPGVTVWKTDEPIR